MMLSRTEVARWLAERNDFLIISHRRPDGDTLGSTAALCLGLRQLGKTAYILENPEITQLYRHLHEGLTKPQMEEGDTLICVDVASPGMLGETVRALEDKISLRIDHHSTATSFTPIELVDGEAGACGEIIYDILMHMGVQLDKPLAAFIQTYRPAFFERVGLRYLNFISRSALGLEGTPFKELLQPQYLGLLADEEVPEGATTRNAVDAELAIRGGCRVKLHAGPGLVKRNGQADKEIKFIFDQDLFMPGQVPVNLSAGALQTLHAQAWSIFRGAITEKLHEALEPR